MTINTSKTKIMIFTKSGRLLSNYRFLLGDKILDICTSYCYLGIIFIPSGNFNKALDSLIDKAIRALFKISKYDIRDNVMVAFKLFNSLVLPIIHYACEVWAPFETRGLFLLLIIFFTSVKQVPLKN